MLGLRPVPERSEWYRVHGAAIMCSGTGQTLHHMQKRLHIYYPGSVQGVGFRFTVERTASSLGLSGWVKNLGDGRVESVVEGEEMAIEDFRKKILDIFGGYIRQTEAVSGEATGEFGSFDIRF